MRRSIDHYQPNENTDRRTFILQLLGSGALLGGIVYLGRRVNSEDDAECPAPPMLDMVQDGPNCDQELELATPVFDTQPAER